MDPAQAARIVVAASRKGPRVLVGRDAQIIDAIVRLLPRATRARGALDKRLGR